MVGGRAKSSNPGFSPYSIGNGALWSAVEFTVQHHPQLNMHYLDLPLVRDTPIADAYLATQPTNVRNLILASSIDIQEVNKVIKDMIQGKYPNGSRTILFEQASL